MARLLITGATGLIGTELVRQAVAAGHEVTVVCRAAPAVGGVRVLVADLLKPEMLLTQLPGEAFDAVVHLAQAADHNAFPANASSAVAINIAAPIALCQWAVRTGCPRFILASSGGICGSSSSLGGRIREDSPRQSTEHLSFYLATKARCEELLLAFQDQLQVDILRYFFVYGRRQRQGFLLPRLASKVLSGEPIELAGGLGPWLNPIHATDAARLTLATLCREGGGITNVAGLDDVSLRAVVAQLERVLGRQASIRETPGEAPSYLADTSSMLARFGRPELTLSVGIERSFTPEGPRT